MNARAKNGANGWCFGCSQPATIAIGLDRDNCRRKGCKGQVRRVQNWTALEIGLQTFRLADGYFAHSAAMTVASHPQAGALLTAARRLPGNQVLRKDGSAHKFSLAHYLGLAGRDQSIRDDFDRIWLSHTFLEVGHTLKNASKKSTLKTNDIFHAPELELIYHIRNGIAHGNRFHFDDNGKKRLAKHAADNRLSQHRVGGLLEITEKMEGKQVLFSFAAPGDLLDVLTSASEYLKRMGVGDQLRP